MSEIFSIFFFWSLRNDKISWNFVEICCWKHWIDRIEAIWLRFSLTKRGEIYEVEHKWGWFERLFRVQSIFELADFKVQPFFDQKTFFFERLRRNWSQPPFKIIRSPYKHHISSNPPLNGVLRTVFINNISNKLYILAIIFFGFSHSISHVFFFSSFFKFHKISVYSIQNKCETFSCIII